MNRSRVLDAGNTGRTVVNASCLVHRINIMNLSTQDFIIVKFYDSAPDTLPTNADIPIEEFPVPTGDGSFYSQEFNPPIEVLNALTVRVVTGTADTNTTSPATSPKITVIYE